MTPMKEFQGGQFCANGTIRGERYYVEAVGDDCFNIYQVYCDTDRPLYIDRIKALIPGMRRVPERDLVIRISEEAHPAIMIHHHVDAEIKRAFCRMMEYVNE